MSRGPTAAELVQRLRGRGITDERVLTAILETRRERFLPPDLQSQAYEDQALPIAAGQTISQPYIVALMTQELRLRGDETVLEIGTGSGYQAAILARLCRWVVTIERLEELSCAARTRLHADGVRNIEFHVGDGTLGWPDGAPYDGILVTAAAPSVPPALRDQLALGGRLILPVGDPNRQELLRINRSPAGFLEDVICGCAFVKLIGQAGWPV